MKKLFTLLFLALSFSAAVHAADKPLGAQEFRSVGELATEITSYFPKVQGEVTAVQADRVTISLGKKDGLMAGMSLTIWREGREILHPVTSVVLGRAEDEVGAIEVISVDDAFSTALITKRTMDPKPRDRARVTPKKIRIALVPLANGHAEIVRELTERLADAGRFSLLEADKTAEFLKDRKLGDSSLIQELGRAMNIDVVVALGLYPSEGNVLATTRIIYAVDGRELATIIALLQQKPGKETLSNLKPFFAPASLKEQKVGSSPELPFLARFLVTGDFEGNGKLIYAFSDGTRLHLYANEPAGWREVWTEIPVNRDVVSLEWFGQSAQSNPASTMEQINVDSADINGNGRPEIFVTSMFGGKAFSYAIEFQEGGYRRIADVPGFLRVIKYPGKGTMLIGQAYDPVAFFAGQPKVYSAVDGKYVAGAEFTLPKGLGLYGWTYANLGDQQPLLVALDDDEHLMVYSGLTMAWKSAEQYVGVGLFVYKPVTGIDAMLSPQVSALDKSQRAMIRGRVIAVDLNNDGRDEIVIQKNAGSSMIGGFTGSELSGLAWTGARLEQVWRVGEIIGPVYDIAIILQAGGAARVAALVKTKGGLFTRDVMQVMSYSMQE